MILNITDPPNHYPVITLNGNSTSDITLNDPWVDPGFTAFDVEDGDITGQVQVTGTVNNNYALAYTIRYEVTDTEGYKAIKTRTVRVNNSMQYLSGTYLCSTDIPGVGFYIWNSPASISASATKNNFLVLSRMTDCYGLALDVEVNGLTLTLPPQLQHGYNTSTSSSGICADLVHYFNGSGTLANITTHPVITINYTDMYKDSTGNTSSFFKTDVYQKQ